MMQKEKNPIGFACAYTPLALIDAAGFSPYRILPVGDGPDRAGHLLHDNLCPHVKRILDRGLQGDLPELAGLVFMNSCDAMRRLADAWQRIRPSDRILLVDLPVQRDEASISFFHGELRRLADVLSQWSGEVIREKAILNSIEKYNELADRLNEIAGRLQRGTLEQGSMQLQMIYNYAATEPLDKALAFLETVAAEPERHEPDPGKVPIFLFGNVLPDPQVFSLFEALGARIVMTDLCTGSRLFQPVETDNSGDLMGQLADAYLSRKPCARTFDPARPGKMAEDLLEQARASGARGVIGHTVKFCDPYLARLPLVRERLSDAGLPFLLLEGDCSMRSIGQHKTRIEAFVEMLR